MRFSLVSMAILRDEKKEWACMLQSREKQRLGRQGIDRQDAETAEQAQWKGEMKLEKLVSATMDPRQFLLENTYTLAQWHCPVLHGE